MTRQLPRGLRLCNPGNLEKNGTPWQGLAKDQPDERFYKFDDAAWGIRAMARTLITYQDKHNIKTVRGIINRWAPPHENNTQSYMMHVAELLEVSIDEEIDVHQHAVMAPLVRAIIRHENGQQPYSDDVVNEGLKRAGVLAPAKPLAKSRTVQGTTVAAAGGAVAATVGVAEAVQPLVENVGILAPMVQTIIGLDPTVLAVVGVIAVAGALYALYARWQDRKNGIH